MKRIVLSLLLFVLAFAVFLVATVPAKYAVSYMPQSSPVQLVGVSGTIWNGQAMSLRQKNNDLGKLEWSLKPLTLLTMKLGVDFKLSQKNLLAEGEAVITKDQIITIENTVVKGDVSQLPLPEDKMLATPGGLFTADITHASVQGETILDAEGKVVWNPAKITSPSKYELGQISLDIEGKDGNLDGKIGSKNSPVNISGTLQLAKNGFLTTNVKLRPHGQTPQEIRDMLPLAGRPARDGSVTIKQRLKIR